jgi:integrase
MATKGKGPRGVAPRGDGIEVTLTVAGKRIRPRLDMKWNAANARAAERIRDECVEAIRKGAFNIHVYFPDYKYVEDVAPLTGNAPESKSRLFADASDYYLKLLEADHSSRTGYINILERHWLPLFHERLVSSITDEEILAFRELKMNGKQGDMEVAGKSPKGTEFTKVRKARAISAKTWNNMLIPLRGVIRVSLEKGWIEKDPLRLIKNKRITKKPKPDPMPLEDAIALLAAMRERFKYPEIADYFEFAFCTGLRTGELIGLEWEQVDLKHGEIMVDRSRTWGEDKAATKTHHDRLLTLHPRAVELLKLQAARTKMKSKAVWTTRTPASGTRTTRRSTSGGSTGSRPPASGTASPTRRAARR